MFNFQTFWITFPDQPEITFFQVWLSLSADTLYTVRCAFSKKLVHIHLKKKGGRVERKHLSHTHQSQTERDLLAQGIFIVT